MTDDTYICPIMSRPLLYSGGGNLKDVRCRPDCRMFDTRDNAPPCHLMLR